MTLEDSLQFPKIATLPGESPNDDTIEDSSDIATTTFLGLTHPTQPTRSGLQFVAVPTDCVGLAFWIAPDALSENWSLQAVQLKSDTTTLTDTTTTATANTQVLFATPLLVPAITVAASADGRLVAVGLCNGSMVCYNVTSQGF